MEDRLFIDIISRGKVHLLESFEALTNKDRVAAFANEEYEFDWKGASFRTNTMVIALLSHHLEMAKYLMQNCQFETEALLVTYPLPEVGDMPLWTSFSKTWSALGLALFLGDIELLRQFTTAGLKLEDLRNRYYLWLAAASKTPTTEMMQWLLDSGLGVGDDVLAKVARKKNIEQFKLLLEHPSARRLRGYGTAEIICESDGNLEFAKLLIKHLPSAVSQTSAALFKACSSGSIEILKLIVLSVSGEVFQKHTSEVFPQRHGMFSSMLFIALSNNHIGCAKFLLENGASPDCLDFTDCLELIVKRKLDQEFMAPLIRGYPDGKAWIPQITDLMQKQLSLLSKEVEEIKEAKIEMQSCSICASIFSDESGKRKRALACGHCLCTFCVRKIGVATDADSKKHIRIECPFCKKTSNWAIPIFDNTNVS